MGGKKVNGFFGFGVLVPVAFICVCDQHHGKQILGIGLENRLLDQSSLFFIQYDPEPVLVIKLVRALVVSEDHRGIKPSASFPDNCVHRHLPMEIYHEFIVPQGIQGCKPPILRLTFL
jgi:hypothetical protein